MSKPVYLALVFGLLLIHLGMSACVPPAADELYYWCWAKEPQWSYYDHPPLTAYLIWASTSVFGDNLFAIRLPACLCMFTTLLLLSRLVRPLWPLTLLLATPLCFFGGILITPDAPLMCIWTAYLVWLVHLHTRLSDSDDGRTWRTWVAGGVLLGLGIMSKYTMGLAGATVALSLFTIRPWNKWFAGFLLHGAVAFVVSLPILLYNIQRDFEPLLFQWQHTMETEVTTIRYLPDYIGGQILFLGWLPFALTPWLIYRWRSLNADPRLRACLWLFLAPFLFFLYKATRDRVELNWPVACYIAFFPLAAYWFDQMRDRTVLRWFGASAFLIPIFATCALTWHLISPLDVIPPAADRVHLHSSWCSLSRDVSSAVHRLDPEAPVFTLVYQDASYLRFHHVRAEQLAGADRPSHFTQRPVLPEQQTRFFLLAKSVTSFAGFAPPTVVGEFPLSTRGQIVCKYLLVRYEKPGSQPAGADPLLARSSTLP